MKTNYYKWRNEMRRLLFLVAFSLIFSGLNLNTAYCDINVGLAIDNDGIKEFHLSVGSHYGIARVEVEKVRRRSLPDDDVAVVLFIAKRAGMAPIKIADLRLKGLSWMDITLKFGLTAEIYHVAFQADPGPPYGKAYGYYKNTPRKKWGKISLADVDIINLVNLKVLVEQHGVAPTKLLKMKKSGKSFAGINADLKKSKVEKKKRGKSDSGKAGKADKARKKGK
jgi:hypothetical protein